MNPFTFSLEAVGGFLLGGFSLFMAARAYRVRKKQPISVDQFLFPLILGVALVATGALLSLGVLTERWARAAINVVIFLFFLVAFLTGGIDERPGPPGTRTAYRVVYAIVGLLWIALCYVSIRDAYRF